VTPRSEDLSPGYESLDGLGSFEDDTPRFPVTPRSEDLSPGYESLDGLDSPGDTPQAPVTPRSEDLSPGYESLDGLDPPGDDAPNAPVAPRPGDASPGHEAGPRNQPDALDVDPGYESIPDSQLDSLAEPEPAPAVPGWVAPQRQGTYERAAPQLDQAGANWGGQGDALSRSVADDGNWVDEMGFNNPSEPNSQLWGVYVNYAPKSMMPLEEKMTPQVRAQWRKYLKFMEDLNDPNAKIFRPFLLDGSVPPPPPLPSGPSWAKRPVPELPPPRYPHAPALPTAGLTPYDGHLGLPASFQIEAAMAEIDRLVAKAPEGYGD